MYPAGETACATNGKSFVCIGGAGGFACQSFHSGNSSQLLRERSCNHAESGCQDTRLVSIYTWNELPQPQVDFTCGLLNLKPEASRVSTKSTSAPSRYSRLAWSTKIFNPS